MKVAMLTYSLRPRGGVVHARRLASAMYKKGIDARLFSLKREDSAEDNIESDSPPLTVFEFKWHADIRERLESMVNAFISDLPRDYDIYHAQDCVCDTALQRLSKEEMIPGPTVRTIHHVEGFADPYLNQCEQEAITGDTEKITVSRYWQERILEQYGMSATLIYNGFDHERFDNLPAVEREPMILFVGGMEARKGLEFAIQIMELLRLKGRKLRLTAVARPGFREVESRAWFNHLIERCGVRGSIEILEMVDDKTLVDLYSRASIFLLPTRMEGWGLSLMEAMAAGCPIVTSPVGGVTELINDDENGILIDPGDLKGFAEAIERVLDSGMLRKRICDSARTSIKRFNWDLTAEETIEKVYRKIGHGA